MNLRARIKKDMINCIPWRIWKYEIRLLSISAQTLFALRGLPIDKLEMELKDEGWLRENESLLKVLESMSNLKRGLTVYGHEEDSDLGNFPAEWTEEDFIYNNFT